MSQRYFTRPHPIWTLHRFHFESSTTDFDTVVRYLSTSENHTPKVSCWGARVKPLNYHIGHLILTYVGKGTHTTLVLNTTLQAAENNFEMQIFTD